MKIFRFWAKIKLQKTIFTAQQLKIVTWNDILKSTVGNNQLNKKAEKVLRNKLWKLDISRMSPLKKGIRVRQLNH
jgi:hypothetical protein